MLFKNWKKEDFETLREYATPFIILLFLIIVVLTFIYKYKHIRVVKSNVIFIIIFFAIFIQFMKNIKKGKLDEGNMKNFYMIILLLCVCCAFYNVVESIICLIKAEPIKPAPPVTRNLI